MNLNKTTYFLLGIILSLIVFLGITKMTTITEKEVSNDYFILKNQISQMNKMVVMEQDFSSLQKTSVSYTILGKSIADNKIITHTKTNAQVSYDLSKMKIEVDSVDKKLTIIELPQPKIKIIPSVEIESMDDSFFNRINEKQIKEVTQSAKDQAIKKVDKQKLIQKGKQQLVRNLKEIFVLAKSLNYKIVDKTEILQADKL
ncbi:MAG: hypothetical protein CSA38_01615 [Flavobacteriales bacterium]|nr:MAG: hypothetical protein CSA38_01615 [Flavobacteriales bacterium]